MNGSCHAGGEKGDGKLLFNGYSSFSFAEWILEIDCTAVWLYIWPLNNMRIRGVNPLKLYLTLCIPGSTTMDSTTLGLCSPYYWENLSITWPAHCVVQGSTLWCWSVHLKRVKIRFMLHIVSRLEGIQVWKEQWGSTILKIFSCERQFVTINLGSSIVAL